MTRQPCRWQTCAVALVLLTGLASRTQAQFFQQAVGGISVDPAGVLANTEKDDNGLRQFLLDNLQQVPGDLNQPAALRKISLRGLAEALSTLRTSEDRMPDEVRFLAGLQRIEYVLVDEERNDIVLAGYGEGWVVDGRGFVVDHQTVGRVEIAGLGAALAPGFDEIAVLVEFGDTGIAIAVGHEHAAVPAPADIGFLIEGQFRRHRARDHMGEIGPGLRIGA